MYHCCNAFSFHSLIVSNQFVHMSYCERTFFFCLSGRELCSFQHQDHVSCIAFSPIDHSVFVAGLTNLMLCWDKRCPSKPVRRYVYKDRFGQVAVNSLYYSQPLICTVRMSVHQESVTISSRLLLSIRTFLKFTASLILTTNWLSSVR